MSRKQRDESELPATGRTVANDTQVVTLDLTSPGAAVGAANISTSTVGKWLKVRDDGTDYYIPMWS